MRVDITCPLVIRFCKEHPSFSIQKLVSEFVTNANALHIDKNKDIIGCISDMFSTFSDDIKDNIRSANHIDILEQIKVHNESSQALIKGMHEMVYRLREDLVPQIREIVRYMPNEGVEALLKSISDKVSRLNDINILSEIKEIVKTTPNDILLRDIGRVQMMYDKEKYVIKDIQNAMTDSKLQEILGRLDTPNETVLSELRGLNSEFTRYTGLFKTGSVKGRNTELKTVMQLDTVFPKHDIVSVPSSMQKGKMDIILSCPGFPNISIDTKNYTKSVPRGEVEKFERDILDGDTHGIMVSVASKIVGKPHFTVDIIGGKVGVYLSNTSGDTECIRVAVDIVYAMDKYLGRGAGVSIGVGELADINRVLMDASVRLGRVKGMLEASLEEIRGVFLDRVVSVLKGL
jgi:hypothetical protein